MTNTCTCVFYLSLGREQNHADKNSSAFPFKASKVYTQMAAHNNGFSPKLFPVFRYTCVTHKTYISICKTYKDFTIIWSGNSLRASHLQQLQSFQALKGTKTFFHLIASHVYMYKASSKITG